jgi:ketosteroid isomerase-like protein
MRIQIGGLIGLMMLCLAGLAAAQQTASSETPLPANNSAEISMAPVARPMAIDTERQQVRELVRQLDDAALHNDADFFDHALAPDYVVSNADSKKEAKAEVVDAHRNGDLKYESVEVRDQSIDVIGQSAIERETADVRGSYKGRRFDGTYRAMRMWKRLPNGNWQLAAMQVLPGEAR